MIEEDHQEKFRDALVRDKEDILENELDRVKKMLWLDEHGDVYSEIDRSFLTLRQEILVHLIGRLYADQAGLVNGPVLTTKELSESLAKDNKTVGARLSELKDEGYVESVERGEYRIKEQNLPSILSDIEGAVK